MAFFTILNQVIVLFLLMGVGYFLAKYKMIDSNCSTQLTKLLCYVVSPCIIVYAFQKKFSPDMFTNFLIVAAATAGLHFFSIFVAHAVFNKKTVKDDYKRSVMRYAGVYSNSGFMGFPLLQALRGTTGLFYGSAYNGIFNLFSWTHGQLLYSGKISKKAIFKAVINPNIIAVIIGILFFRFSIALPGPVYSVTKYISDLNTPLSMIVIGTTMTQIPLRKIFSGKLVWAAVVMRNFVLPFLLMFLLHAVGLKGELLLCVLILASCPCAGMTVLFAKLTGKDSTFPGKILTLSTILSLATIPLIVTAVSALKF